MNFSHIKSLRWLCLAGSVSAVLAVVHFGCSTDSSPSSTQKADSELVSGSVESRYYIYEDEAYRIDFTKDEQGSLEVIASDNSAFIENIMRTPGSGYALSPNEDTVWIGIGKEQAINIARTVSERYSAHSSMSAQQSGVSKAQSAQYTIYEHNDYQGRSVRLSNDIAKLCAIGMDNRISSVKLEGGMPWVVLYDLPDYDERESFLVLYKSESNIGRHCKREIIWCVESWNDRISSIEAIGAPPYNVLSPGEELIRGRAYYTPQYRNYLMFREDGNLVWVNSCGSIIAQTFTHGQNPKPDRCIMQTDGNLVLYAGSRPTWNTETWVYPGAVLRIREDRNLEIVKDGTVVWKYVYTTSGGAQAAMKRGTIPGNRRY